MVEMVSNVRLHPDIGEVTHLKRNEGVRCSKRVLDGMCLQMATTSACSSTSSILNNNNKSASKYYPQENEKVSCNHDPCSSNYSSYDHHPVISIIGPLYAPDDFDVLEPLGEGFFSKVYKVKHVMTGEIFVLKKNKPTGGSRRASHADAAREAAMMRKLKHENILELRGICISRDETGKWDANLLVSYCQGGSLSSLILDKQVQLTWAKRVKYAKDIACAMEYIHGQQIIHRDLTSSNVLICNDNRAVVADFGLSCPFPEQGEKLAQVGTTYFMSPECLKEEFYDEKSDVFSFGIILCQMIARVDADPDGGLPRTSKFGFDYMLFTPLCPLDTPIELLKLAFNSCVMDPTARPRFVDANHKLSEIMTLLPQIVANSKNVDGLLRDGKESRLGRSRSDAALKRPKSLASTTRKLSTNWNTMTVRPVIEGEVIEETSTMANRMEELARHVARDEPEFRHINPFVGHERFRNERKILPPTRIFETPRRRSETKPDGCSSKIKNDNDSISNTSTINTPRRRCLSMPCSINDTFENGHYTSFSYDGTFNSGGVEDDDSEYIDANSSPASGIPMAYRDFDRKFLKQMIRFPSRRHTMHPDIVQNSTNSSFELSNCQCPSPTVSKSSVRRFVGGKDSQVQEYVKRPSTFPNRQVSIISEESIEKQNSIVTFNEKTPKRKGRRVCTRSSQECSIL
ncbi:unnamed protein product [Caenorhabditis angaria]|uniref:Protein kinase domain-containing protein n=1 Tax=Caenorhabditis angaria TaxID=860376 RepID=A0A9P1I9T5_9PELO|nr:unnamed protein product [Caenorhabditis angaria]